MEEKRIEIIHGFKSMQSGLAEIMMSGQTEKEKDDFRQFQKKCGAMAYNRIKEDFLNDKDIPRFITNVSLNISWCIKACFADKELPKLLSPEDRRRLTIECFIREGHDLPTVRREMKKIVANPKYKSLFSGEIVREFEDDA